MKTNLRSLSRARRWVSFRRKSSSTTRLSTTRARTRVSRVVEASASATRSASATSSTCKCASVSDAEWVAFSKDARAPVDDATRRARTGAMTTTVTAPRAIGASVTSTGARARREVGVRRTTTTRVTVGRRRTNLATAATTTRERRRRATPVSRAVVARRPVAAVRATRATETSDAAEADADAASARTAALLALVVAAASDVGVAHAGLYDSVGVPADEATPLQNLFGFFFTAFSFWYFARAVQKRSGKAREFRVANQLPEEERKRIDEERSQKTKELTAMQSLTGGLTGLGISAVLYVFASKVSASFDGKALPESETVRQISITVRTIVEGLSYLATFVYAANGVGLIALAGQKTLDYVNGKDLVDAVAAERDAKDSSDDA